MKVKHLIILFILALSANELSAQAICAYKYRKRITFNPASVVGSNDLIDFPVIISISGDNNLRSTGNGGHVQNTSGYDIVFTASDGVTQLDHQLTDYTASNGSVDCWIKIPVLSTSINTDIYMYYGNASVTTDQSTTNTWSNGYVGVWHFDGDVNNSTATVWLNGTNNGTTDNTTSKFGNARRFQSNNSQYIEVTPYNANYNLFNDMTVSAWVRPSSTGIDQKIAGNEDDVNGGWKFGIYTDNKIEFEIRDSWNAPYLSRSASGGSALSANTWYYAVGQYSNAGDFIKTYLNGSLDRDYTTTASCWSSNGTLKIGREPFASTAFLNARMDELRISNVIRSADWIATEYNNQNAPGPGTFYTISAEPGDWLGSTNTNWSTGSNWSGGSVPASMADVMITGNPVVLNASPQVASLWLKTGTTLSLSNRTLSVAYDITNCGTITGSTGYLVLNSGPSNIQSQNLSGAGAYNLTHLTINNTNSNPAIVLNNLVNVAGNLQLTSGIVYTSAANILALGTTATSSSGSANSFVSGPISKVGTTDFIFPIGKGTRWRRAGVSNITASTTFRAEYFSSAYSNTNSVNAPLTNISTTEYWLMDRTAGTGNAKLSLYWESATGSGITNCPDLTIARWNGASWDERAATTVAGSNCSGGGAGSVLSNAVITAFSPFTFASKLYGPNPLPVELSEFRADCEEDGISLKWTTESEINNNYFKIERSEDGIEWASISRVNGSGTSHLTNQYTYTDPIIKNGTFYYRINQVDNDAAEKKHRIAVVTCERKRINGLRIYPNPASSEINLRLELSRNYGIGKMIITDSYGRTNYETEIDLSKSLSDHYLPIHLSSGAYLLRIISDQLVLPPTKLIVQRQN